MDKLAGVVAIAYGVVHLQGEGHKVFPIRLHIPAQRKDGQQVGVSPVSYTHLYGGVV